MCCGSGEKSCCICAYSGGNCLATMHDDYFARASIEQLKNRLKIPDLLEKDYLLILNTISVIEAEEKLKEDLRPKCIFDIPTMPSDGLVFNYDSVIKERKTKEMTKLEKHYITKELTDISANIAYCIQNWPESPRGGGSMYCITEELEKLDNLIKLIKDEDEGA